MNNANSTSFTQISFFGKIEGNYSITQSKVHAGSCTLISLLSKEISIVITNTLTFYSDTSLQFNISIICSDMISNGKILPKYTKIAEQFDIQPLNSQPIIICKPIRI